MDCEQVRISYSVEPDRCLLRLEGALGVGDAAELRLKALEVCACQKDVRIDWSAATQMDAAIAQVLLALRARLASQNRNLSAGDGIPPAIQAWLDTAGLAGVLGNPGHGE